jgi:predicted  nucleic acid-binding Zn-ribbon protein
LFSRKDPVHPHVKKLLELQRVDQEVSSLTKDLDSLPAEETRRRRKLEEVERNLTERRNRFVKAELDARALDKAIRGNDDEIKRLNERLNTVRNNAEYQATLFQIEAVRKDRDVTQEECLKLLESVEAQRADVTVAQAAYEEERKTLEGFLVEADLLRSSRAGAIAAVRQRRKAMTEGIPDDLLREYDGLFKTRSGIGVCAVEKHYCQGCYNKITMNDTARLLGKSVVVRCGSCQRILYMGSQ